MEQPTTMPVIPGVDAPEADEALVSFGIATAVRDAAISVGILLGLRGGRRPAARIVCGLR
jgi:hypothetical protein